MLFGRKKSHHFAVLITVLYCLPLILSVYNGEIPGNVLGFNLFPGCSFSGTVSNTTTVSGLNAIQVT